MEHTTTQTAAYQKVDDPVYQDFKSATFILSLTVNLALFILWVTIQVQ